MSLLDYIIEEAELLLRLTKEYDWNRFQEDEMAQNGVCMFLIKIQCQQLKEKSNHLGRSIRMNASSKRQNLS